jgi:replicative DNA helicase
MATTITPIDEADGDRDADVSHGHGNANAFGLRQLPRNVAAEQGLLGALFVDNRAYERVSDFLYPEHFYLPAHQRIFEAAQKLIERGQIADPTTLRPYFEADESLSEIGGAAYLANLTANAVSVINAKEYGRIIYDSHLKRELITIGEDVVNEAFEADLDSAATAQIEKAEARLYELATTGEYEGGFKSFKDAVITAIEMAETAHRREGSLAGVGTGFRDLDKLLGGLHPSDLLILAGRPSMGKTALATNLAYNAAHDYQQTKGEQGGVVGFFSLEMSAEQLAARILSEQSNISSDRMRKGELSNEEFNRLFQASNTLHSIPLFIDDTPALTVSALRTRARRLKRSNDLGLIVVDYLQLIQGSLNSRSDGRVQEVSEITRGLKTLAKELNVPVIALSQLSRQVEQRENKRPQLSDLRESGSIEQDADVVLFIYREEYYLERERPQQRADEKEDHYAAKMDRWETRMKEKEGVAEVIVAKQRHGPIGDVELSFQGEFTRFGDLDRVHTEEF